MPPEETLGGMYAFILSRCQACLWQDIHSQRDSLAKPQRITQAPRIQFTGLGVWNRKFYLRVFFSARDVARQQFIVTAIMPSGLSKKFLIRQTVVQAT